MPEGSISVTSPLGVRGGVARLPRLPDQLEIKFGPIEALGRYILRADRTLRDQGIKLSICTDFEELADTNRRKMDRGWYDLPPCFASKYSSLDEQNAFWLKGVNDWGDTVLSHAIRFYVWQRTTLKEEVESLRLLYERMPHAPTACGEITAPAATKISGRVCLMGALWLDPDYRGQKLASTVSPLTRAVALSRWYPDYCFSIVSQDGIDKGRAGLYGWPPQNVEPSVKFCNLPGYSGPHPHGSICFLSRDEMERIVVETAEAFEEERGLTARREDGQMMLVNAAE